MHARSQFFFFLLQSHISDCEVAIYRGQTCDLEYLALPMVVTILWARGLD